MSIVDGASGQKDGVDEFRGRPDQDNERRRAAVLRHDTDSFSLPLSINGRSAEFLFDTGASTTDLNATFADAFRGVVDRSGGKGTASITGAGGTRTFESAELPELAFAIDLSRVSLRPASVTLQRIRIIGGDCCVGNVGHDLLAQTQAFSIDFSTMTLRLE